MSAAWTRWSTGSWRRSNRRADLRAAIYCANYGRLADATALCDLAVRAEAAGWDGCFVYDQVVVLRERVASSVDAYTALAAIAARTESLTLGPMITPIPRRRPWELAHQVISLDRLSKGRVVLGVGLGEPPEYEATGDTADARALGDRLDEGLDVLTRLLAGEVVDHDGTWRLDRLGLRPGPVQSHVPIWVAGRYGARRPLRRAARYDGVFPINTEWHLDRPLSPQQLREVRDEVWAHRHEGASQLELVQAGVTPGDPAEAARTVAPYAAVGATWWLEILEPVRGSLEELGARVDAGPPRA